MALKFIKKYLAPYKLMFGLGLVVVTITSALNMIVPYLSGVIVENVIKKHMMNLLIPYMIIILSVTLVRSLLRYGFILNFENISQNIIYKIRQDLYNSIQTLDAKFYDKTRTGDIMSKLTGDVDAVRHFIAYVVYNVYENALIFIFGLAIMFYINFRFALIVFVITIPTAYIARRLAVEVKPTFTRIRTQFSKLNTVVEENISGNKVVKAFAKENYEIEKFQKANVKFKERNIESSNVWCKYLPLLEFLSGSLNIVTIIIGGYMVIKNSLTIGELITFNSLIFTVNNPIRMSGWLINDIQRFSACSEKILEILKAKPEIYNKPNAIEKSSLSGSIEFKDVCFSYDDTEVLHNINLKINSGETIGIMGATGAGKTSFINLLCRFYDCTSGSILIDGENIKKYNLQNLRGHIGISMQDIFLFSDTIEGNIAYGMPDAPFEDAKKASSLAQAHGFINELPESYDTIIGERGVGLSGGQKQRISLARALMRNPDILILDDTTSAVDMETEHEIQKGLKNYSSKRTTFIIAHRISSVKNSDKIIVLDEGKIVELGNHEQLMKNKSYYYDIYMSQLGNSEQELKEVVSNG